MSSNRYIDTRGLCEEPVDFTQAVVNGLAHGGGLYVSQTIPHLSLETIAKMGTLPYAKRASIVYKAFDIDMPDDLIDQLLESAYGTQFDTEAICPITSIGEKTHVLELWHGPTSAFKDMALQCLPRFFSASSKLLQERGKLDHSFFVLVATSGDTGKAALDGFRDVDGVSIGVMYPHGGVSDIQYRQMATQRGNNVCVWAVRGNFDDCQTGAKNVFSDEEFAKQLMSEHKIALSSANSINWGRLLPQVVYYISSYSELVARGTISLGDPIDVCVPTGNFGNILAAWYAKQMGTPIEHLVCASNENRVLTDFINSGTYDISDRKFILTPSPSMDILVSSNLERQLFELNGRNPEAIRTWMADLKSAGTFSVDDRTLAKLQKDFIGDWADNEACFKTIKDTFDAHNYLLDPHTAVAYCVAQRHIGKNPMVIASTAHWAKFGTSVYRALNGIAPGQPLPQEIEALSGTELNDLLAEQTGAGPIPKGLAELSELPIRFSEVIDGNPQAIEASVTSFLSKN